MPTTFTISASRRVLATAIAAAALSIITPLAAEAADPGVTSAVDDLGARSIATFEGRQIDLSKSWEGATACSVDGVGHATCFRSEFEMDRAIVAAGSELGGPPTLGENGAELRAATCSSSMRLYRNNSYSGGTLYLTERYTWINLSLYGFDNAVSSYTIGGCDSIFRSGNYGGGSTYWGGTSASNSRSSMSGWDDVLSSVYMS